MLSGALMANAEELLRMGLSPTEVAEGYETACEKALKILPGMTLWGVGVGERKRGREGKRERERVVRTF